WHADGRHDAEAQGDAGAHPVVLDAVFSGNERRQFGVKSKGARRQADGWSDGHRGHRTVRGPHRPAGRRIRAVRAQIVKTSSVGSGEDQKMFGKPKTIPTKADALPGRTERMPVPPAHFVNQHRLEPPFPEDLERAMFGMGCFWGAERKFWELPGVYSTAV